MRSFVVEVVQKPAFPDSEGAAVVKDARDLGLSGIESVRVGHLYCLEGEIS